MVIWDVLKQTELRAFDAAGSMNWPAFRWSADDKFFVRSAKDMISVYETPHMGLLEKKSIKLNGVQGMRVWVVGLGWVGLCCVVLCCVVLCCVVSHRVLCCGLWAVRIGSLSRGAAFAGRQSAVVLGAGA